VRASCILFLAANPQTLDRLALDEECRDIEQKLNAARYRDAFKLRTKWAVRPDDLQDALLREEPAVVHFSGHGSKVSGIVLHDGRGHETLVAADALRHLFSMFKSHVRLIVLNACYSESQAKAIVQEIDFVVGMNQPISDEGARTFAASFYRALAFGRSVKAAFDLGVSAIKLHDLDGDDHVPVLLVRPGMSAETTTLIAAPSSTSTPRDNVILKLELRLDKSLGSFDEQALMRELSVLLGSPVTGIHITELRRGSIIVSLGGDPEELELIMEALSEPGVTRDHFIKATGLIEVVCRRGHGMLTQTIRVSSSPSPAQPVRRKRDRSLLSKTLGFDLNDLKEYLELDAKALFSLIPPYLPEFQATMFNLTGQERAGLKAFQDLLPVLVQKLCVDRDLCKELREPKFDDDEDLLLFIVEAISPLPVPVPPLLIASIILKVGPGRFCGCPEE
jgi:hypothetical protein